MPKKRKNVIKFDMTISALPLSAEDLTALRFAGFYYISELQAVSIDSLMFSDARKERIKEALQKHITGEDLELDDVDEDNFDDFDFDDDTMDELLLDDADFDLSLEDDIEDLGTDDNESDEKRKHASSQTTKEAAKSSSAVEESFISAAATPIANNKTQLTKSVLERDNKRSVPTRSISYKKEKEKTADSIFDDNIDPQAPVFPDFKVVDNQIIHIPSKLILKDSAIEAFLFSARPYNCLKRVGIDTVQGIVPLTIEELLGIRNLGKKSAGEIYEKIKKYLVHQIERNGLSYDEPEPEPEKEQQLSFNGPISIVPHADNHPRLGSEYAVIDSIIVNRFNSTGVNDAPISELALSTRSYNGLFRNKIYRVSQLIGMLIDDLFAMKNLGKKSADEIFEKLNKYLMLHSLPINGGVAQIDGDDEKETPSIIQIEYTHDSVMSVFIGHEIEILSKKQIIDALPNSKVDIDALIEELLEQKKIEREGDGYQLVLPTFDEMLSSGELPLTPRETKILLLRSAGFRLEEVGVHFNCTRERIRQIEAKALRKMKKVYCAEDRHSYLFQTYRITKKEWKEIFNSSGVDYYYLQGKYKKGNAELEKAIDDLLLSTTEKRIIQNKLHKGLLRVGDRYIPLTRHDIEDYVLREYCREECTIDQFIDIYNSFVMEHTDDNNLLIDTERE